MLRYARSSSRSTSRMARRSDPAAAKAKFLSHGGESVGHASPGKESATARGRASVRPDRSRRSSR
jgi:hypothetical protein